VKDFRKVSGALLGEPVGDDVMFVAHSGRYEMKNKGIDVFIDSLAALRDHHGLKKEIIAFILVPANQIGPRRDLDL
jgi:glycogen phosphorylase/synthase